MSEYKAGTWMGKVTDYGIGETKSGDPNVFIVFDVEMGDAGVKSMTWRGSLKEGKAREITFKALLAVGFKGSDPATLLDGPDSGAIDLGRVARLVCEMDEYEGKPFCKISWVNNPEGGAGVKRADAATAKAKMLKMNLAGDMARVRAANPQPEEPPF